MNELSSDKQIQTNSGLNTVTSGLGKLYELMK